MSPIDFKIDTIAMKCTYDIARNGLLTCSLVNAIGIEKKAENVSFLFVEPTINYQSSLYYEDLEDPNKKFVFRYDFKGNVSCRVLGNDTTSTIKCNSALNL